MPEVLLPKGYDLVAIPVDSFLEVVEIEVAGCANLLEHTAYERLLGGWKGCISTPTHEIRIAAEAIDASRHELLILTWVHALLEVGKAKGIALWLVVAIERAMTVNCDEVGVEHDILSLAAVAVVPDPGAQTVVAPGTVAGQTSLVAVGD